MGTLTRISTLLLIPTIGFGQALTDDGTNVGIGNSSPVHRLDVDGDINMSPGKALLIGGNQVISTAGSRNIFLGDGTGLNISTGADNAIIGFKAGENLDEGTFNTLIGLKSGQFMTSGFSNTVIGRFAGQSCNGNRNVLIGREAGITTDGQDNTFIGDRAGRSNLSGNDNTMIGKNADVSVGNLVNATAIGSGAQATNSNQIQLGNASIASVNTSGQLTTGAVTFPNVDGVEGQALTTDGSGTVSWTTVTGVQGATGPTGPTGTFGVVGVLGETIYHNGSDWVNASNLSNDGTTVSTSADMLINGLTIGLGGGNLGTNTANGVDALHSNTSGSSNTAIGDSALYSNTIGSFNTANGYQALYSNTEGNNNTATGMWTLYNNTEGFANTASGNFSLLSNTTGDMNTATGNAALLFNITGSNNTANGSSALYSNIGGNSNTALGNEALYSNASGSFNTANGNQALYSNTDGNNNTATGMWALYSNTDGFSNTANGNFTLLSNTSGDNNTANGNSALHSNTTGSDNTANGVSALFSNVSGIRNTANGGSALYANSTGNFNTATGYGALSENINGSSNTAIGNEALFSNTTGFNNSALGRSALHHNTTGYYNSANGYTALYANTTGYRNTACGYFALAGNISGNFGTAVGHHAHSLGTDYDNSTGVGYNADPTAGNTIIVGNSSVTSIGGQVGWTTLSDKRFKTDIRNDEIKGLEFITALEPVSYTYDLEAHSTWKQENYGELDTAQWKGKNDIEQIRFSGFIAQDVEAVANEIGYSFSGVDAPKNDKDVYGLRYAEFVVPLVKAVQELNTENELQRELLEAQRIENEQLRKLMDQILENQQIFKSDLEQCCFNYEEGNESKSSLQNGKQMPDNPALEQNQPNPFRENSVIKYYLPENANTGELIISDLNGVELKTFQLQGSGFGQILISGGSFKAGIYLYTLLIDGIRVDSKRMMLL